MTHQVRTQFTLYLGRGVYPDPLRRRCFFLLRVTGHLSVFVTRPRLVAAAFCLPRPCLAPSFSITYTLFFTLHKKVNVHLLSRQPLAHSLSKHRGCPRPRHQIGTIVPLPSSTCHYTRPTSDLCHSERSEPTFSSHLRSESRPAQSRNLATISKLSARGPPRTPLTVILQYFMRNSLS
jgi:hypothetical protein